MEGRSNQWPSAAPKCAKYVKEYDSKWEPEVAKLPVVISFPGTELKSRDVVIGLRSMGGARLSLGNVREAISRC